MRLLPGQPGHGLLRLLLCKAKPDLLLDLPAHLLRRLDPHLMPFVIHFFSGLIFIIAWPVTIALTIAACCCLCFCRVKRDEQPPKPTVRNVQYVQQQRPVAQPTVQYVQPMPQQHARRSATSPCRTPSLCSRSSISSSPSSSTMRPPPPPPQPAPPPPPQYVAAEATVVEAAPGGRQRHRDGAGARELVGRRRIGGSAARCAPGHKAPAVISHCMRHMEQPLPSDRGSSSTRWQPRRTLSKWQMPWPRTST